MKNTQGTSLIEVLVALSLFSFVTLSTIKVHFKSIAMTRQSLAYSKEWVQSDQAEPTQ